MISGHQGFLTSGDQDAKTSIRTDFLASLFHDGLSSRFIHSVLMQFCSRYQFRERTVRLFRLAGEQAGTERNIRPVFGGQKHYMFCPRQAAKDFRDTFARKQGRSGHFGEGKWRFIARIRLQDSPFSVDFRRLKMQNLGHSEPVFEAFSVPISPRNGTFIAGNSAPVYALTPARRGRRASWGGRPSGGRRRSLRTAKRWYSCGFGPSANRCDERCGRQRSGCVVRQSIFDSKRIVVVKLFAPGFSSQTEDSSYSILYG